MMRNFIYLFVGIYGLLSLIGCGHESQMLLRIQENGYYGFVDTLGNVKIAPQYKYVGGFSEDGYALVISKAEIEMDSLSVNYGFINMDNELAVDTTNNLRISIQDCGSLWKFHEVESFVERFNSASLEFMSSYLTSLRVSQGRYPYVDNNLIGYKNMKGEIIIPAKYKYAGPFYKDVAIVSEGINFDSNKSIADNLKVFSLIDLSGGFIKKMAWSYIAPFSSEGLTWCNEINIETDEEGNVSSSLVWTQIDTKGKITIGPVNGSTGSVIYNGYPNNDNLYMYYFPEMLGMHIGYSFINKDGKFATDRNGDNGITMWGEETEVFDDVTSFSEGFAGVKVFVDGESRWTFMNPNFELATQELYDSVKPFTDDLAVVQQLNPSIKHMGDWGVIDRDFSIVIPYKFSEISTFSKGFAYAKIRSSKYDREGWINRKGDFIWETNRRK